MISKMLVVAVFILLGLKFPVDGAPRNIELPVETVDDVSCIPVGNYSASLNYSEFGFCERYSTGMAPLCDDVLNNGDYIFVPNVRVSLDNIVKNVQTQFRIFELINQEGPTSSSTNINCFDAGRLMFCYWYFIPCGSGSESSPGLPRPLCMDECLTISADECISEWETAISLIESDPSRVPSGFGLPDCCNLSMLTGPIHNCCQPLEPALSRQEVSPPYEVCFPELATEIYEFGFNDTNNTTVTTTTTTTTAMTIIIACTIAVVVLLLVAATSISFAIILLLNRRNKKNLRSNGTTTPFPGSTHSTLVRNNNYGISLDENVSYSQQQRNGSSAKVRSVYRREIESHNLVIPIGWLTLKEVLGEGEFGTVRKGLLQRKGGTGRKIAVAIKKLKGLSSTSQEDIDNLVEESLKMKEFYHRHVMGLYGICLEDPSSPMIVMPFMSNGSLLNYLRDRRKEWEQLARNSDVAAECGLLSMCRQIALGMEYLARLRFVHRDLAARNCMVDSENVIKVADFGLSRDVYNRNYYQSGRGDKVPARWMPVEALVDGLYTEKSDVWAYGVTCWEVFTLGYIPYPGVDIFSIVNYLQTGNRLPKPDLCSNEVYDVMQQCWEEKAKDRPTFSQLSTTIEGILESKAGYVDLNVHTTLETGLQAVDPPYEGMDTLNSPQDIYTEIETNNDLTESGYVNV